MPETPIISGWERALMAAERVKERLYRSTGALEKAVIPYAVVGGNAVAEWVGRVDEGAVRNTRDVDILIRRADLEYVKAALAPAGFVYCQSFGVDMFLDGPEGRPTEAVHIHYEHEPIAPNHSACSPSLNATERLHGVQVLSLAPLLEMYLSGFRTKERMFVRELIDVGLGDQIWTARLSAGLASRLQQLIDTPDG